MSLISVIVPVFVLGVVFTLHQRRRPSHPYPPGPKGRPLIGNALDIPKDYSWLAFSKLGQEYGPLTYLNMVVQPVIIINGHKTAVDLLERRGSIYSDRYYSVYGMEMCGFEAAPFLQSYTPRLRFQRKLMHSALSQSVVECDVWPLQEREIRIYLNNLLDQPDAFLEDLLHFVGGIILKLTYGAAKDGEHDFAQMGLDVVRAVSDITSGHLVDVFPILKHVPGWMPGAGFQQKAAEWRKVASQNLNVPFDMVKRMMATGEASPSFCKRLLDENEGNGGGKGVEVSIMNTAVNMYAAGTDTTSGFIHVFFLTMLLHPQVQLRAQEEIDRVIGKDRLPSFRDRDDLPYVEAVFLECLRWYPTSPIGVPHCVRQDDVYNGYHIPVGSILFTNLWGISRDEKEYTHADKFDPSRWLSKNKPLDPRDFVFGYGRRICPGLHIAQATIWITIVSILSTFNIKKQRDSEGEEITPPLEFTTGIISRPKPFTCDLEPRSEQAVRLIRESVPDALEV